MFKSCLLKCITSSLIQASPAEVPIPISLVALIVLQWILDPKGGRATYRFIASPDEERIFFRSYLQSFFLSIRATVGPTLHGSFLHIRCISNFGTI